MPAAEAQLEADLVLIAEVAREAGKLSLEWLEKGARAWDKSPDNPVTEADIACNDLIARRLRTARPHYGWLSEETRDSAADRSQPRIFVVDPIDGTKAFIKGENGFCASIAIIEDGQPIAGAVYNPNFDELLTARIGSGCHLNGEPVSVADCASLACTMIGQPDVFGRTNAELWPDMKLIDCVPNAMAWRLGLVAAGHWDAAVALNDKNDWDIAAAVLLVREAGGVVTDRFGRQLEFNRPSVVQNGAIAAGASLHPLLLERLHDLMRKWGFMGSENAGSR